jgi:hypothetical protein
MTLKGAWTPELVTTLNTIAEEIWAKWEYGIHLERFETEAFHGDRTATFFGSGRWAFCWNLEALGQWTAGDITPDIADSYNELLRAMHEDDLTISISYSDVEGGCAVLYTQEGVISSDGAMLTYMMTSEENFDYNSGNYVEVTGDSEGLDSLIESLCEEIGIEKDEGGLIRRWAGARLSPYCSDFEDLDGDTRDEFLALFQVMPSSDELDAFLKSKTNEQETA